MTSSQKGKNLTLAGLDYNYLFCWEMAINTLMREETILFTVFTRINYYNMRHLQMVVGRESCFFRFYFEIWLFIIEFCLIKKSLKFDI
jgi:hypothetical protein